MRCDSVGVVDKAALGSTQPHGHFNWAKVPLELRDSLCLEVLLMGSLEILLVAPLLMSSSVLFILLASFTGTDHSNQTLLDLEGHVVHVVVFEQDGSWQCCSRCALDG